MKKKLKSILIIDDCEADIYILSRVIKKAEIAENIIAKNGAQEALDYLSANVNEAYPSPELIFLDVNMPGMTGWEFLEKYMFLPEEMKAQIVVCMITTSHAEEEKAKALKYGVLDNFSSKPVTHEKLMSIIENSFPTYV